MGWQEGGLYADLASASKVGKTPDRKTAPFASAEVCASNGLSDSTNSCRSLGPCWGVHQQLLQNLHNALARVSVPLLGNGTFFPLACKEFLQGRC